MNHKRTILEAVTLVILIIVGVYANRVHQAVPVQTTNIKTVTKDVQHDSFDPNRTASYECTPAGTTMTCSNPDGTIQVDCTSAPGVTPEYFC